MSLLTMGFLLLLGAIATAQPNVSIPVLTASSPDNLTDDRLTATYTPNGEVVAVASVWYRVGRPFTDLYLPFEGGPPNAMLDYSGYENNLSTTGNPLQEPVWNATGGRNGTGAFDFDGDDFFLAGDIFPMGSSYTKTAWIRMMGTGYRNIIGSRFNGNRDHHFKVNPDSTLNAGHSFGAEIVQDFTKLNGDQWYFVAVTFEYETGEMILYKDGVEVDWGIVHDTLRNVVSAEVQIGARADIWGWVGSIDEARIYDRALSPEQISARYNEGNDVIVPQETANTERWRLYVTPFSASDVGTTRGTFALTIVGPEISGLNLAATSPDNLTTDDLVVTHTNGLAVVETATAWYKNGSPESLLYLPFEGGSHSALLDFSGNDNHVYDTLIREQHPSWDATGGHNGSGAFTFDGNDFLVAGDILPLAASYTKTAWVNMSGINFRNIMSSMLHDANNHTFKVNPGGFLAAGHSSGASTVEDGDALTSGIWYFVAVTFDFASGDMILYKNGDPVISANVPVAQRTVVDPSVLIGAMDESYNWVGSIDEPRLYDRALSPEQISSLYNNGNTVMVAEETTSPDEWYVEVTPFAATEVGSTTTSNTLNVHSIVVSDIDDLIISEGATFTPFDLDTYVLDYDYADNELTMSYSGNSELDVDIDVDHNVSITIPDLDWYGSEDIYLKATNPLGDSDSTLVTFTVLNVNDAPVLTEILDQNTDEDIDLTGLMVSFTDADDVDTHTITVVSGSTDVTVENISGDVSGSTYNLVPVDDWSGSATITVTVTDNGTNPNPLAAIEIYTLIVDPVNDDPLLTEIGNQSTDEDNTLNRTVTFTDPDALDTHIITVVSGDGNVTVENISGDVSGSTYDLVPAEDWNGSATITVTVTEDGTDPLFGSEAYLLTVDPVNDPPVISEIGDQVAFEDTPLTGLSVDFDEPDAGDTHTISVVSLESNVTVVGPSGNTSGSTYDLVPADEWIGTAQITVTVTETAPGGLSDTEIYALEVGAVNDPPVLTKIGDQSIEEDNSVLGLAVDFSDLDPTDEHIITVVSSETGVSIANLIGNTSGSTYDLVPDADWSGSTEITVTVTDNGTGELFDFEDYTFTVDPINDAPALISLSIDAVEEGVDIGTVVGLLISTDPDIDDTHVYEFMFEGGDEEVDNLFFEIVGEELRVLAELDYETKNTFALLLQSDDGNGGTLTQQVPVTVVNVVEVGIGDENESLSFRVYPVPAVDRLTVEVDNPENAELLLEIYSNAGVLVHSEHTVHGNTIDLSEFSKGMYILRIQGESVFQTRKIIVGD